MPKMMMAELILLVIFQTITQIGTGIISTIQKPLPVRIPFPILQIKLARNRIIQSLAISAGCTESPRFSHLLAPFASMPRGVSTSTINIADTKYPSVANLSQK